MSYYQYCAEHGVPAWPYPTEYDQVTRDSADVLVIGGGLSGCFAAMHAAERGCSVIMLEKGATVRSGSGGTGTDHWMFCATNPGCKITIQEMFDAYAADPYCAKHLMWIIYHEAYDSLLDLERIGVKVRDTGDDFKGAPFRDEKTKLLYAYDYDARFCIRPFSHDQKIKLYEHLLKLGVKVYDRVMGTSLLNEGGKAGNKVIGATAINTRTGRFYVFNAKTTILATAKPLRLWQLGSETVGGNACHDDPNGTGAGDVMAFRAGAKLINMEATNATGGGMRMPPYSTGNTVSTWYPATMVDADGKEIPWVDRDQNPIDVDGRCRDAKGQKVFIPQSRSEYAYQGPYYAYDLGERLARGEFKQPFYADLSRMPAYERNVIFGLMVGNEAKSYIPVFDKLSRSGFDPEKDVLQAVVMPPKVAGEICDGFGGYEGINGINVRDVRGRNYGGVMVDWQLRSTLEGLYAAGNNAFGIEGASSACATGRYCGRNAAKAAQTMELCAPDEEQVARERERLYQPLQNQEGYGWKEVQLGLNRIMQDYCGKYKSEEILKVGLWFLDSVRKNEMKHLCVANPHDLMRAIETATRLEADEIIMQASLGRDTTNEVLDFHRTDCPSAELKDEYMLSLRLENGQVHCEKEAMDFWLRGDNAADYEENYRRNACL